MAAPNTITTDDGFVYQLTDEDLDWASRMLANEGGDPAADLFTMAQRFVLLHRAFPTFTAMIRAFSQPINPKWLTNGEFCRPGGRYYGTPSCSGDKLAHRETAQSPSTHYPDALAYVQRWARGEIPNPVPRATDFRAGDDVAQNIVDTGRMELVLASGNWYFAVPETASWSPDHVLVGGRGTAGGAHIGAFLAVLALAGLAAGGVWLYREHVL